VAALGQVAVLVPAIRIMRVLVDPPLMPGLYVLGAFFLTDLVRRFASVVPAVERQIFLFEMLAGIAALAWWGWRQRTAPAPEPDSWRTRAWRRAAIAVLLALVAALAAGIAGYMSLAVLLGAGLLGSGYVALVLYAGVRVVDGLVAFALRETAL